MTTFAIRRYRMIRAYLLMYAATAMLSSAQTFTTLVILDGTNGSDPYLGSLLQATDGNLYGTTSGPAFGTAFGTIFKMSPAGVLTTLYSFTLAAQGSTPYAGLVQATNGDLYGTTSAGGANNFGTVFKITTSGTLTTLYSFCAETNCADGSHPQTGLVQAINGDLYGTTSNGGTNNNGTIFKITPAGALTTLYKFNSSDGIAPNTLLRATNGYLYGTTGGGGAYAEGTIFKITPAGSLTTIYNFNKTDGAGPYGALIQATNGDFYGTTAQGGALKYGTIFKLTPAGILTTLWSFDLTHGSHPFASLVQATDGNLYGTTQYGGAHGHGTIFKLSSAGLTTLHSFAGPEGAVPQAGLTQDTNGDLYGTTVYGGSICAAPGCGTIFRISLGLGPFVKTLPIAGVVGSTVQILGTGLTGATVVTFNGVSATFTVVSDNEIATILPTGAATGKVQVVTPNGTLTSNVAFEVAP